MLEGEREKLLKMERAFAVAHHCQKQAITDVSNAVRRSRSGLQDPNRRLVHSFILGPTGVGKTETARGSRNSLRRRAGDDSHRHE